MAKQAHTCLVYKMSSGLDRKKRNMAALTPQFKIKHSLEWDEFVRVEYAKFSSELTSQV